jgi:chemotaxis regulatin CheY-phosphate phosphatase CheZ
MSQDELDALMGGGADLDSMDIEEEPKKEEKPQEEDEEAILPPLPSKDNKMVEQLDDVTKESEKNASEIFDSVDVINEGLADIENNIADNLLEIVNQNIDIFEKLSLKFPQINTFKEMAEKNSSLKDQLEETTETLQTNQDEIMVIMDKMQFQDIHRQKIERVINIMRSLANYMNHLFSSSVEDSSRVSSAKHIPGDETADLVGDDDIEALINSFGK